MQRSSRTVRGPWTVIPPRKGRLRLLDDGVGSAGCSPARVRECQRAINMSVVVSVARRVDAPEAEEVPCRHTPVLEWRPHRRVSKPATVRSMGGCSCLSSRNYHLCYSRTCDQLRCLWPFGVCQTLVRSTTTRNAKNDEIDLATDPRACRCDWRGGFVFGCHLAGNAIERYAQR